MNIFKDLMMSTLSVKIRDNLNFPKHAGCIFKQQEVQDKKKED